jgi:hypothetical protein
MGSLPLQPIEVEVEQTTTGGPGDAELPADVYGNPTVVMDNDRVAGL